MVIQKTLVLLILLFTLQLVVSCDDCVCPGVKTYEVHFREVEVTPYNTAGFADRVVEDSVPRNAFGLEVLISSDLNAISQRPIPFPTGFGYNSAMACDCVVPEYVYPDSLDYVTIWVADVATDKIQEITSWFARYDYASNELIPLEEFFQIWPEQQDGFRLELVEYEAVPRTAVFTVEAYLKSGETFTTQTAPIFFYN